MQKTAYEMRISDWSSDVCSSDLDAHRLDGAEAAQLRLRPLDPLRQPVEELEVAIEGAFDARAQDLHRHRARLGRGGLRALPRLRHDHGVVDLGDRGGGDRHRIEADEQRFHRLPELLLQNARSEEHTSELQSLMRISYAV